MKAAIYRNNGAPEVLSWEDMPVPQLTPTGVLIRVEYVSVQGGDVLNRRNTPPPAGTAHVVGYQAAGIVEKIGGQVTRVAIGDRVVGFAFAGSHAELFLVDELHAYPVPDGLSMATAATLPVESGTAHDGLFEFGKLVQGESVLVRGAAGGVGMAAVRLARQVGATVIAVAATPERNARIIEHGAHYGIDYQSEDVVARVRELTGGQGVDLAIDMAGGSLLIDACKFRGRYVLVGGAGGDPQPVDMRTMALSSLTLSAFVFGKEMGTPRVRALIADLMRRAANGELSVPIERIFPLDRAAEGHRYVEDVRPVGRVLLEANK